MAKVQKKPTAKVKAGKAKTTAKKAGKKKAATTPIEVGTIVQFKGYAETVPEDERVFESGDKLQIVAIDEPETEGGPRVLSAVKAEEAAQYAEDEDSVTGGAVMENEVKRLSGKALTVKPAPQPIKVVPIGDLASLIKKAKGNLTGLAVNLYEEAREKFFYFGGVLATIYNENIDAPEGTKWITDREAWEAFVLENFDMGAAKARAYMDIYNTLSVIPGLDTKKLADIGWSKVTEIARYATEDNFQELVTLAEKKPIDELKTELKTVYVDAEGKTPSGRGTRQSAKIAKTTFSFVLYEDRAPGVRYILEAAQKMLGLDTPEATFEHIVNDWAGDNLDPNKVKKAQSLSNKAASELKKRGIKLPGSEDDEASAAPAKPKKKLAKIKA